LHFIAVGGHESHDIGATCFHKFTGAEGIFLNHYLDTVDEYVVADMCAGADPFSSSGLATRYDACVVVLEPTLKSIAVYHQARHYGDPHGVRIFPVANKIAGEDDRAFIEEQIAAPVLCAFQTIDFLRRAEQGHDWTAADIDPATQQGLETIKAALESLPPRDWTHYQTIGNLFHKRACDGWASAMYGYDLMEQIDPDFTYPQTKMAKAA
jgi:CO dehydrogenase maturation factor